MNRLNSTLVLLLAFLMVFLEATVTGPRNLLRAQIDVLPALVVLASLRLGVVTLAALAVLGGLWFDSLSANPLGVSVLPLFVTGFVIQHNRELILRDQPYAQFVIGVWASAAVPVLTLLVLLSVGENPLIGWATLWQGFVMCAAGGALTPLIFRLFDWLGRALAYRPVVETSFRLDREIKRGRF